MTSLRTDARIAGVLYVLASAVGIVRLQYIPSTLFVDGKASATAANIAAHATLFRFGMASGVVAAILWLFVPLALFRLLDRVDRNLAVLMVILGAFMQVPLYVVDSMLDAAALAIAQSGGQVAAFDEGQRAAMVQLFLNMHHQLDLANLMFGGLWLLPFGLLVFRSGFLPRLLGAWLIAGCFAWIGFSLTGMLFPAYEDLAFNITQPIALGEVATMLWLVVVGASEKPASRPPQREPRLSPARVPR